jgi:hypothetical protein
VQVPGDSPDLTFSMRRRAVEESLISTAGRVSGVTGASASAGRRKVSVEARTQLTNPGSLHDDLRAAVDRRVDDLGLTGQLQTRTRVKRKKI